MLRPARAVQARNLAPRMSSVFASLISRSSQAAARVGDSFLSSSFKNVARERRAEILFSVRRGFAAANESGYRRQTLFGRAAVGAQLLDGTDIGSRAVYYVWRLAGVLRFDADGAEKPRRGRTYDIGVKAGDAAQNHQCRSALAHYFVGDESSSQRLGFLVQQAEQILHAAFAEYARFRAVKDDARAILGMQQIDGAPCVGG